MSHFPKKTVIIFGLLTAFLALPILGIPWALKAYIFFFLGVGVAGFTYVTTLPRKRKDFLRRGKGMVTFPESTSQIIPEDASVSEASPQFSPSFSEPKVSTKNVSSPSPFHTKNSSFLRAEQRPKIIPPRASKKHLEKEKRTLAK